MSQINPWDAIVAQLDAQIVGGQLIAVIAGKHVMLGHINHGQLVLTDEGKAAAEKVDRLDHDGDGAKGGSRRTRRPKEAAAEVETPETGGDETLTAPVEVELTVADETAVGDQIG